MKKTAVVSDIHLPYHDPIAVALFMVWLKDFQPDEIILNGDIADMASVSAHGDQDSALKLESELLEVRQFLSGLRKQHPKASIVYMEGNHEDRLKRYLKKQAPTLEGMIKFEEVVGLKELDIRWLEYGGDTVFFINPRLGVTHGAACGEHYTTTTLRKYNVSLIVGHNHRPQFTTSPTVGEDGQQTRGCWGGGCLTDVQHVPYLKMPSGWTQGWTAVYSTKDIFSVYPVNMHKHRFVWNGKEYGVKK